jgi:hypothetical protein
MKDGIVGAVAVAQPRNQQDVQTAKIGFGMVGQTILGQGMDGILGSSRQECQQQAIRRPARQPAIRRPAIRRQAQPAHQRAIRRQARQRAIR